MFYHPEDAHLLEVLARWTVAFPRVLMCHLRENMDTQKELAGVLTPEEIASVCAAAHRPIFVLQVR